MKNFNSFIQNLSKKYDIETGTLPISIEQDIQSLIEKCPNIAYCNDFLNFQRQFGGFILYLDNADFWVYSINSNEIFPMLTGEGDLVGEDGFMCIADYSEHTGENGSYNSKVWAYKVDELPFTQKIYISEKIGTWELAYQNFTEMLEKIEFKI